MRLILRSALTLELVAIAAFSGFGFLASYESPEAYPIRWLYGDVIFACVAAIVAVWVVKAMRRLALTLVLIAIAAYCGFGFLASYKSSNFLTYRWLYGAAVIACVAALARLRSSAIGVNGAKTEGQGRRA